MDSTIIAALIQAGGLILAVGIVVVFRDRRPIPEQAVPPPKPIQTESKMPPVQPPTGTIRSLNGDTPTPIEFRNVSDRPVKLFWLDYSGKAVLYTTLEPGEIARQNTFLTHPWLITDEDDGPLKLHFPELHVNTVHIGN